MQSCNLYFTILEVNHEYHKFIYAHQKASLRPQGGYLFITSRSYFHLIFQCVADAELQTRNEQNSLQTPDCKWCIFQSYFRINHQQQHFSLHVSSSPHKADTLTPFQSSHITLHTIITPSSDKLLGPKAEPGLHNNTALKIPLSVIFLQNKRFKTK